ncbi:hypothetical protein ACIA4Q_02600 [Lactobacillus delbrueckii subsp. bulgaricus]
MSEYEFLSKWAHEFNRTDEMVRGGFTAVVEKKRVSYYNYGNTDFYTVKVFWNGVTVLEYGFTGRICAKKTKTEWYLQGRDAERILKKYFSLIEQLGSAVE